MTLSGVVVDDNDIAAPLPPVVVAIISSLPFKACRNATTVTKFVTVNNDSADP